MKKIFLSCMLLLLPLWLFAQELKEGEQIVPLDIKDQFTKNIPITAQTKQIIVVFSKEKGEGMKLFFEANPTYLADNNAVYLMDISSVPSLVMSMFMLPKLEKYNYSVGLLENEKDIAYFPKKENCITVITLENLTVTSITYKENL